MTTRILTVAAAFAVLGACRKWKDAEPAPAKPEPPAATATQDRPPADPTPTQAPERRIVNAALEPFPCGHLTILARDPETGDLGYALLTGCPGGPGFMAAAKAGVGVAVCGNYPDSTWAQRAIGGLAAGKDGPTVLRELQESVTTTTALQIGLMAADGTAWVFTGTNTLAKSADVALPDLCVFGTNLVAPDVPHTTLEAYQATAGLPLAERLLLALREAANIREPGSKETGTAALSWANRPAAAALVVLRLDSGHDGRSDRLVDVRLDWHPDPLPGLEDAYRNQLAAVVWPRLKIQQRGLRDAESALYKSNARWLTRLRLRKDIGER